MRATRHYQYGRKIVSKITKKLNAAILSALIILPTLSGLPLVLSKQATAVGAITNQSYTIDENHSSYFATTDTSGLTNVTLSFQYDISTLDDSDSGVVLNYSAGSASSSVSLNGQSYDATKPGDIDTVTLSGVPSSSTLNVQISSSYAFSHSDDIKLSNITVSGDATTPTTTTGLTTTAAEPSYADTCGYTNPISVTSHVDSANPVGHNVVVRVTADSANPAPAQVRWFGGAGSGTLSFMGNTAYYDPTGSGFPLTDNQTAKFQAKFSTAGTYKFTSQIVSASDHNDTIGAPLVQTTKVSDCYIYINEVSPSSNPDWVELYGSANMDMSGWKVEFGNGTTSNSKTLPAGTHINGQGYLVVGADSSWLDGSGGTVKLFDAQGNLQRSMSYGDEYSGTNSKAGTTDTVTNPNDSLSCTDDSTWAIQKATSGKANDRLVGVTFDNFPTSAEVGVPQEYTAKLNNYTDAVKKVLIRITLNPGTTKDDFTLEQKVNGVYQPIVFSSNGLDLPRGGINLPVQGASVDFRITFHRVGTFGSSVEMDDIPVAGVSGGVLDMNKLSTTVVDTTAPAEPTNLSWQTASGKTVSDGGITNEYSGTAIWQDGTPTGETSDVDHYVYKYWNDIPTEHEYNSQASSWPTTTTVTLLPDLEFNRGEGVHHFCVVAVDAAGNESSCSTAFTITYDGTNPEIQNVKVNFDSSSPSYNPINITADGIDPDASNGTMGSGVVTMHAFAYRSTDGTNQNGVKVGGLFTQDNNGKLLYRLDFSPTGTYKYVFNQPGDYYLDVWSVDAAGNVSNHVKSNVFKVDHQAPAVTINSYSGTNQSPILTGTITDGDNATIIVNIDGTDYTATNNHDGTWSLNLANIPLVLGVGTYNVSATATDLAGNATNPPATATISVTQQPNTDTNTGNQDQSGNTSGIGNTLVGTQTTPLAVAITPLTAGGGGVASGLGVPGVLGTSTTQGNTGSTDGSNNSDSNDAGVKGDSTNKNTSSDTNKTDDGCFEVLGVCWYWWVPVVIIVIAIIYYLSRDKGKKAQNITA